MVIAKTNATAALRAPFAHCGGTDPVRTVWPFGVTTTGYLSADRLRVRSQMTVTVPQVAQTGVDARPNTTTGATKQAAPPRGEPR